MEIKKFKFLSELKCKGYFDLNKNSNYALSIYQANIPFRPGIYLVYSLDKNNHEKELLYYGKAGVTENNGDPHLNFHQLPERLLAATTLPKFHPCRPKMKEQSRSKLWPWYVDNIYKNGIRIYWYITAWPEQNPNDFEKRIKKQLKYAQPTWKKSI